jgi:hypothetical protein
MDNAIENVPIDPIGLNFKGADQKGLADALVAAFPDPVELNAMLVARLDQPLNGITAPFPLPAAAFGVVGAYKARGHLLRLMAAARASQPDNPVLAAFVERFALATATPPKPKLDRLEKIVKDANRPFAVAVWRQRLEKREVCVCRIEVPTSAGIAYGTGFLVSPSRVLTNHHVVAPALPGYVGPKAEASKIVLRFDYKELLDKTTVNPGIEARLAQKWLIDSSPYSAIDLEDPPHARTPTLEELDYALIELAEPIGGAPIALGKNTDANAKVRGWIELSETPWPFTANSTLMIIQHPDGRPLSLAMETDLKMEENANQSRVTYRVSTEPGSSGSPCFNQYWDLIALHHAGDPLYPELDPKAYNEGIPIHRIVERLKRGGFTDGLTIN